MILVYICTGGSYNLLMLSVGCWPPHLLCVILLYFYVSASSYCVYLNKTFSNNFGNIIWNAVCSIKLLCDALLPQDVSLKICTTMHYIAIDLILWRNPRMWSKNMVIHCALYWTKFIQNIVSILQVHINLYIYNTVVLI